MGNKESAEKTQPVAPLGQLGVNHIPEFGDLPKVPENDPKFEHLFLGGHLREEVIEKLKPPREPEPSYTRGPQPAFVPDLPVNDRVVVGIHFVKCQKCRDMRDGKNLF